MPGAVAKEFDEDATQVVMSPELIGGSSSERAHLIMIAGKSVGQMFPVTHSMVIGRADDADIRLVEDQISRRHARIITVEKVTVLEDLGSTNGTFVNGERMTKLSKRTLADGDKIQIGATAILKFTYHDSLEENFQRQMYESALRDPLTKVFNKRHFSERLQAEFAYSKRYGVPLSLVMFDLDHFKKVNDTFGHPAGDAVLKSVADIVNQSIRAEDVFARYGGEEFAIVSRATPIESAQNLGERIRKEIEARTIEFEKKSIAVTISLGLAALPNPAITTPDELIQAADGALYDAKRSGRNRIVVRRI